MDFDIEYSGLCNLDIKRFKKILYGTAKYHYRSLKYIPTYRIEDAFQDARVALWKLLKNYPNPDVALIKCTVCRAIDDGYECIRGTIDNRKRLRPIIVEKLYNRPFCGFPHNEIEARDSIEYATKALSEAEQILVKIFLMSPDDCRWLRNFLKDTKLLQTVDKRLLWYLWNRAKRIIHLRLAGSLGKSKASYTFSDVQLSILAIQLKKGLQSV